MVLFCCQSSPFQWPLIFLFPLVEWFSQYKLSTNIGQREYFCTCWTNIELDVITLNLFNQTKLKIGEQNVYIRLKQFQTCIASFKSFLFSFLCKWDFSLVVKIGPLCTLGSKINVLYFLHVALFEKELFEEFFSQKELI